jgi:pimeloyl-ACP methyl ester carboxylesterase
MLYPLSYGDDLSTTGADGEGAMPPATLTLDVSDAVGSSKEQQSVWVFAPDAAARRAHDVATLLVCLPGGTYGKQYWHLDVPGHGGYSFAEHLAAKGYVVAAVDHLGVGDSSRPPVERDPDLRLLAAGDAEVARQLRSMATAGTLVDGLPGGDVRVVGVGHSMGACLTTMVQAGARPYDALVLLGYSVSISNVHRATASDEDPAARLAATEAMIKETFGSQWDDVYVHSDRKELHPLFHLPDVPRDVVAADDAVSTAVPRRCAFECTTPGFVQPYAEVVDVPIFLGLGEVDVSPDPWCEPAGYRASRDITLVVQPGSAHCHNFASTRRALWDRVDAWLRAPDR